MLSDKVTVTCSIRGAYKPSRLISAAPGTGENDNRSLSDTSKV